jgi:hypothetical protein
MVRTFIHQEKLAKGLFQAASIVYFWSIAVFLIGELSTRSGPLERANNGKKAIHNRLLFNKAVRTPAMDEGVGHRNLAAHSTV